MSFSKIMTFMASASLVAGHGYVSGVVAGGKHYTGYLVDQYSYMDNPPETIGWSTTATDLGFVSPSAYQSPDIICHEDAKPGALTAPVQAGSDIQLEWTTWPESHHGPVITYLAPCNGDCSSVDKSALKFSKIDAKGLIDGSSPPGIWATDNLIDNNGTWTVTIPADTASGNYVLRHEIIALHSAGNENGAQNYPQCLNIKVTGGGGGAKPEGTAGVKLYKADAPGILVNIYTQMKNYVMPGPSGQTNTDGGTTNEPTNSRTTMDTATATTLQTTTPVYPSATPSSEASTTSASPSRTTSSSSTTTTSTTTTTDKPDSGKPEPDNSGSGSSYGSCSDPAIKWTRGLDGRKEGSWVTNNQNDFPHGSSTTLSTLTGFICNRLVSPCRAPQDMIDLCHASAQEVENSGLTGADKSGLWSELMV